MSVVCLNSCVDLVKLIEKKLILSTEVKHGNSVGLNLKALFQKIKSTAVCRVVGPLLKFGNVIL